MNFHKLPKILFSSLRITELEDELRKSREQIESKKQEEKVVS